MSRHFASPSQPWFRLGRFDIGTTELVGLGVVASFFLYAVSPTLVTLLALSPVQVVSGLVWQVVTWPLANVPSVWSLLSLLVFWWVGRELETETGRNAWAFFLVALTLALSVLGVLMGVVTGLSGGVLLAGIGGLSRLLVLTYIAQHPRRPFFFGIPAWVVGVAFVTLDALLMLGGRQWLGLVHFGLSLLAAALLARSVGLLTAYDVVPFIRLPRRRPRAPRGSTVRTGPWEGSTVPQHETDELDSLLDKIAANGLGSLTEKERRRLDDLRKRRRGV